MSLRGAAGAGEPMACSNRGFIQLSPLLAVCGASTTLTAWVRLAAPADVTRQGTEVLGGVNKPLELMLPAVVLQELRGG